MTKRSIPPGQVGVPFLKPGAPSLEDVSTQDPKTEDISIDDLLAKSLLILFREVRWLLKESVQGKLSKDSADTLRHNIKLLQDLKAREAELLEELSDEALEKLSKK